MGRTSDEEWQLIEGTEDYYISNRGRFKHGKKLRKVRSEADGYMICNIGHKKYRVHRLVAKAFIPNPDNLPVVDHIDGDKTNNNVENLRWVTYQENTQAAYDLGLNKGSAQKDILAIDSNGNVFIYESQVKASEHLGIPKGAISKVCRGILNIYGGYKFFRMESFTDFRIKKTQQT